MALDPRLRTGLMGSESDAVKDGCSLLDEFEPCDDEKRGCKDIVWALLFWCTVGGMAVCAVLYRGEAMALHHSALEAKHYTASLEAIFFGSFCAFWGAILFLQLLRVFTFCMVWTALLLSPVIMIIAGVILLSVWPVGTMVGGALSILGILLSVCIFFCWRNAVPFTVLLIKTVIAGMEAHPSMFFISLFSSSLSILWSLLCAVALLGMYVAHKEQWRGVKGADYAIYFAASVLFGWGSMVAVNTGRVACCGVFGRWFFQKDQGSPICLSLKAAFITSFGSVCLGSLIVATLKALRLTLRAMRRAAAQEGNIVVCIILSCLEIFVGCIEDIIDWVNDFAYVQCAVRGLSFCAAAKATFALCNFSNCMMICADSLVTSVVFLGAVPVTALGTGASYGLFMLLMPDQGDWASVVCIVSFMCCAMITIAALQPLESGATTFVVCWAENPSALVQKSPELAVEFGLRGACWDNNAPDLGAPQVLKPQPGSVRNMAAAPMIEMQHSPLQAQAVPAQGQMLVTVPDGVMPGQLVQTQTPEGVTVQVQVPPGYGPGTQFLTSYTPTAQK